MAYSRGNLALKERARQEQSSQQRFRETTKVVTRRKELPVREKLLYLFTVIVCVGMASLLIHRYAQIYQMSHTIYTTNEAVVKANIEIDELRIEKERLENLIVSTAKEQGYTEPTKEPIRVK